MAEEGAEEVPRRVPEEGAEASLDARRRRRGGAAAARAGIDVAALSVGVPPGWRAFYDVAAEDVYYGNVRTGETSWDPP